MDPFTEKLLERTRARRENLQRKLAERPNAANRQMVKRPREPLTESNNTITDSTFDKVPQISSKPSPSKRRCSEETQLALDEENQVPVLTQAGGPEPPDPLMGKKTPVGLASIRSSSSLEQSSTRPVQSQPKELKAAQPENMAVTPGSDSPSTNEAPTESPGAAQERNKPDQVEDPAPSAAGMKSRLQRLAQQRKCWDEDDDSSDTVPDSTPPNLSKRPVEVQLPVSLPPSEAPVRRRGRLANLAATIESWEDDLIHAQIPKGNPGSGSVHRPAVKVAAAAGSKQTATMSNSAAAANKSACSINQDILQSAVKSRQMILPSPQKAEVSASKTVVQTMQSPLKNPKQEAALPPSPHKATSSEATSAPKSPLKTQLFPRTRGHTASLLRPAHQDRATMEPISAGGPGVKSVLERFGERCQQHKEKGALPRAPTPGRSAPSTASVTPNTKLAQERLQAAQAAHTATAELTQRQKMERESELAQIRNRFQKGEKTVWENKDKQADETHTGNQDQLVKPTQKKVSSSDPQDEPTTPFSEEMTIPSQSHPPVQTGITLTPPVSTSSPMRGVSQTGEKPSEEGKVGKESEMNVDHSINSAIISELFDGVLEQSEDQEEEEDSLNISSMSLLAPLAETVAAVVKSPDRRLMISTPASSLVKSNTPESSCSPEKFQKTTVVRSDESDEDHRLPYSIDAYRSIRVKEPERPAVKQVIVRKEDVSKRAEEPRAASLFSMKQRMKMLTSEVNLQQTVIHQASQALNCCTDEEHGKGSQVEAEAERLLLLAMEKREALKTELDRLKGESAGQKKICPPEPVAVSASKGSITLQELRLPLKADFVCSTANKPDSTKHSFFIMIRSGAENMVATPLASTHRGLSGDTLSFPTKFTLSDVSSDFKINLEVYFLVQKREICSEKKKKPNKTKAITPKRFLAITKSAQTPVVASPGGPNAVRTSSFVLVGSHTLTLSSIGKNMFPLEKVPFLCPLEGHIHLQMQCEVGCSMVEERGFLTMFEDVSGFGAWHRRWCVLSGYCISYWTYPDDEKRKNPIGRINLANCTSKKVEPANREFCARPNTFELITVRPQREDDRETLVSQCMDAMCVTKNWLSADTKDERNLWMKKLNQILVDLRIWQPAACYKPL
ncbi:anillin [Poeciliopsis prolifica]|uniref:anillin n=1 Tax=Poeciliopsis prolifica TaxID=188132 RepID=UPI0024141F0B|nr:anillin [Poeciliopsis prolifica]